MIEYWLCFGISCLLIFLVKGAKSKSPKFILFSFFALLLPCLLAAFRADQIGTDVNGYINPLYNLAKQSGSIEAYWNSEIPGSYRSISGIEPGFNALVYISAKFFRSRQVLLGMIQLLTITPIYFGLKRFEDKIPLWFGMMVYYLMYYNVTLNMMRQWIAMAFLLYAFKDLLKRRYIKYIIFIFFGTTFHNSALIGVIFIALRVFFDDFLCQYNIKAGNLLNFSLDQIKELILILVSCTIFFIPKLILLILELIGLENYSHYFYNPSTHFLITQFIVRLPIVVLFLVNLKELQHQLDYKFLFGMTICDVIFCNYVSGGEYMYRVACWFSGYNIYSYPMLIENFSKRYKQIAKILLFFYLIAYWWFYYCHKGSHQTVPYVSVWD